MPCFCFSHFSTAPFFLLCKALFNTILPLMNHPISFITLLYSSAALAITVLRVAFDEGMSLICVLGGDIPSTRLGTCSELGAVAPRSLWGLKGTSSTRSDACRPTFQPCVGGLDEPESQLATTESQGCQFQICRCGWMCIIYREGTSSYGIFSYCLCVMSAFHKFNTEEEFTQSIITVYVLSLCGELQE